MRRSFTQEELEEIDFPYGDDTEKIFAGRSRWEIGWDVVFPHEGRYWKVRWFEGATEMQDYDHFDFYDMLEAVEVVQREVPTMQWVEAEEPLEAD